MFNVLNIILSVIQYYKKLILSYLLYQSIIKLINLKKALSINKSNLTINKSVPLEHISGITVFKQVCG